MDYQFENLDIRIGELDAEGQYPVEVLDSPDGSKTNKPIIKKLPLDDYDFQDLILFTHELMAKPDEVKLLGEKLYENLIDGQVANIFFAARKEMGEKGKLLRLRLRVDDPALSTLPWEYARGPGQLKPLALDDKLSFVRYMPEPAPAAVITAFHPIRLLVAVASPPGLVSVNSKQEIDNIRQAVAEIEDAVELRVIPHATYDDLRREITFWQPHILHFIGHGVLENGRGALALEGKEDGQMHSMSAEEVSILLGSKIKTVVLNACNTATHTEGEQAIAGVAQSLIRGEIPAVLAMQFKVPDDVAVTFAKILYGSLVRGMPLDAAVTEMRILSRTQETEKPGKIDKTYWAIPVLYMRATNGLIWLEEDTARLPSRPEEKRPIPLERASGPLRNYLEMMVRRNQDLALPALDGRGRKRVVPLADVFVDLDAEEGQHETKPNGTVVEVESFTSTLAHIYHNRHLVLLGDAGAGTSTLLRYLSLCLANARLEPNSDWLERLSWAVRSKQPGARKHINLTKRWVDTASVPILIELGDFSRQSLDGYAPGVLWRFVQQDLEASELADAMEPLQTLARRGEVLFLLHGMNKVRPEARESMWQITHELSSSAYGNCRWIVSSRPDAFSSMDSFGTRVLTIRPLDQRKITNLARNLRQSILRLTLQDEEWLRRNEDWLQEGAASATWLLQLTQDRRLRPLAENPMFLTLIVLRQADFKHPRQLYARLYEDCVDFLLDSWQPHQESGEGDSGLQDVLERLEVERDDLEKMLWEIAWEAQKNAEAKNESVEISASKVMEVATKHLGDWIPAAWFMKYTERGSHVLSAPLGIGVFGGNYAIRYPLFQQYLAACHLAHVPRFERKVRELAEGGEEWLDVLRLAAARVSLIEGDPARLIDGVERMVPTEPPRPDDQAGWRRIWIAAEMLSVAGLEALQQDEYGPALLERLRLLLAALLENAHLTPIQRAEAGDALGVLNDPRPGVCTIEPEMMELGDFRVGKYPVTNAQFRPFVEDGGYVDPRYQDLWGEAGWRFIQGQSLAKPKYWLDLSLSVDNKPVVGVSQFESDAYAKWLSSKLNRQFALPSLEQQRLIATHPQGRTWPWGSRWRDGRINTKESGVHRVTAVGCFPEGSPPNGVQDILGNVWEWSDTCDQELLALYTEGVDVGPPVMIYGGCYVNSGDELKYNRISSASADSRDEIIGFRLIEQI